MSDQTPDNQDLDYVNAVKTRFPVLRRVSSDRILKRGMHGFMNMDEEMRAYLLEGCRLAEENGWSGTRAVLWAWNAYRVAQGYQSETEETLLRWVQDGHDDA